MENRITISICDEEYTFVAEEAPSYMQKVGSYVNDKMSELLDAAKVGRTDAAVLTAVNITDELFKEREAGDALRHQRKRGIGRDVGENLDLRAGKGRGIAGGRAVFGKIGVRDEQHALGVQPGEGRGGVRAEAQPRAADKALHDIASFRR